MSSNKSNDAHNNESENINKTPFAVQFIQVLSTSKGVISKIFDDLPPIFILRMLSKMGEEDALSYIKKDSKRRSSYITVKNPPLKFKKFITQESPCSDLLVSWFVSKALHENLMQPSDKSFDTYEESYNNQLDLHIKLTEKLLAQDDSLRAYIALGCLLSINEAQECFGEEEISNYLHSYPKVSKDLIVDYLAKIKKALPEDSSMVRQMIEQHEKEYEDLALKVEEVVKELREHIVPEYMFQDEIKQLADSLEKLRTSFKEKFMTQEGHGLPSGITLNTIEDIKKALQDIESLKQRRAEENIDAAKKILKKIKSLRFNVEEKADQDFVGFREKIDALEYQIINNQRCRESLLSGNHVVSKLLRYIENKDDKPTHEEIGMLLLDLQAFCGPEDSIAIIGNLMVGKIALKEMDTSEQEKSTLPRQIEEEGIKPTVIRRREANESKVTNITDIDQKETIKSKSEREENKIDEVDITHGQNADNYAVPDSSKDKPADEKREAEETEAMTNDSGVSQDQTAEAPTTSKAIATAEKEDESSNEERDNKRASDLSSTRSIEENSVESKTESLNSAHIYARIAKSSIDKQSVEKLLCALIYDDDLPGAYWLSVAIETKYNKCIVPPWMIKATQGARWLVSESVVYVDDLLDIAKTHRPEPKGIECIIGLATAIRSALIQPGCGLIDWLQKPGKYPPELITLVESVREFAKYGRAILPEEVRGLVGSLNLSTRIQEEADAASRWLKNVSNQKGKFRMATEVWKQLSAPKGEIFEFLQPVINNDKSSVQRVKENLSNWQRRDFVDQKIDAITEKNSRVKVREIVGSPRQHIIRNIEDACEYAHNWCQLTEREQEYGKRGNKLSEQIKSLQTNIRKCIPGLREMFRELNQNGEPTPIVAALLCLARSINQVLKDINVETAGFELATGQEKQWQWLADDSRSLDEALCRRLIMIPGYLSDQGINLQEGQQDEFIRIFCNSLAASQSLEDIFNAWIKIQDYRYVDILKLAFDDQKRSELQVIYDNAITESNYNLKEALVVTGSDIEQALVDGVITEEIHSEYNAQLQAIELSSELNYKGKNEILQNIQEKINNQREQRLSELKNDWEQLYRRMDDLSEFKQKKEQVKEFLQSALDRKDTRVIEESLSHLREVFDKGIDIEESLFRIKTRTDDLDEYIKKVPKIKEWLEDAKGLHAVEENIERGVTRAGIIYGDLSKPRRDESAKTLELWRRLKQQSQSAKNLADDIAGILQFMAFNLEFKDGKPPVQLQNKGKDWVYCTANMSAGDLAKPIPQFGSLTRNRYDIICLWERPGADTIAARLRELRLDIGTVIVFYLGRLYDRQRRDLVRISRDRTVNAVLLDEILLVYLTKAMDAISRLPIFLRCSLPYTVLNPYMPFQAGDVPPEMFFGREDMIRELQKMGGSCIVYGGRQLGKSALLRRVQREFHNPVREQYAAVLDIKLLGDPKAMQQTSLIWGRVRDSLKGMGLLTKNITTDRSDEIKKYVMDVMHQDNKKKLILFFDEADNFLEADARDNFREVEMLRTMMLESGYRFKVVFAGLQNVQRFQGIPNQPLAHFGTPIRVGPLEPDAAQRLVIEPIEAIGYRFEEEKTTVLRMLSYTNYHPGLIQLFCQELIKRLESTTGSMSPPFLIRQEDVEAVYRLDEVRNRIKERFDWTLALNSRYQAIAWLMVFDQIDKRDSYARTYPPGNILKLARDSWQEGFGELGLDELRGLLDEMCGLGVLVRNRDGHYRLRSPNLVRLLGTDEDILNNLDELVHKHAPLPFNADNYHFPLDDKASSYSP